MRRLPRRRRIRPGDLYEDCSYHPCVCEVADKRAWPRGWRSHLPLTMDIDVEGVSLLDGSRKVCSARHCAPFKLTRKQVLILQNQWDAMTRSVAEGDTQRIWAAWRHAQEG